MAFELERLTALNNQLKLVGRGADTAERQKFCSAFTQEAARLLFAEGWRRIRKTDGQNVDGMDIDKLVHANTFRVVDLIVDAGLERAKVSFNDVGELRDTSRFIEVRPVEVPAPPAPPTPTPEPPTDDELLAAVHDLVNGRDETNRQLNRVATALEAIAAVLVGAGKRFGIEATWTGRSL